MSTTTLSSLALLKLQIDNGTDHYDNLRLLIEPLFKPNFTIDADNVAQAVLTEFGLQFPDVAIRSVLKRMERRGDIRKTDLGYSVTENFQYNDQSNLRADASNKITTVINNLIRFATSIGKNNFTQNDALEAVQLFLADFQIECIKAYIQGSALPEVAHNDHWKKNLVGHFVVHIYNNDVPLFEMFMVIVQGNMLANALICSDSETPPATFRNTKFYLDTPLLLRVLGLEGDYKKRVVMETIELLNKLAGRVLTFEHLLEETDLVIKNAAEHIEDPLGYGPIVAEARQKGWTKSDVLLFSQGLAEQLKDIGIEIRRTPNYVKELQIDETDFEDHLDDQISYRNEKAQLTDITSVRSIYVLRNNKISSRVEDSRAILVTNNSAFVRAAYDFNGKHFGQNTISAVIRNYTLANLAWIKAPYHAENLIGAETIAAAYSSLRVTKDQLEQFLQQAESLERKGDISQESVALLRADASVTEKLSLMSLDDNAPSGKARVTKIIDDIKRGFKEEASYELRKERERHRQTQDALRNAATLARKTMSNRMVKCNRLATALASSIIIFASVWFLMALAHEMGVLKTWHTSIAAVGLMIWFILSLFGVTPVIRFESIQLYFAKKCFAFWAGFDSSPKIKPETTNTSHRAPNFSFVDVEIGVGEIIHFRNDNAITAVVVGAKAIEFEGQTMSLSAAALVVLHRQGKYWKAASGPDWWMYNGERLSSRRSGDLSAQRL